MKYSGIGGQAVMEGIMMKNGSEYAVAVRKTDGEIIVKKEKTASFSEKHAWAKWPLVRGVVNFVESLVLGMGTLTWSAGFQEEPENGEEKKENNEETLSKGEMAFTIGFAVVLCVGLFVVLPTVVAGLLKKWISSSVLRAVFEGVFRLLLFIGYVAGISLMKDIKRVYMYHGSEHKCINCIEHGLPLTVDNVMKSSKEHRRCGTSFLIIVMLISIIVFLFIRVENPLLRILSRLVMIPVIAGISYEILRFTGRSENRLVKIISRPGMWMQGLTTKEPTPDMVEVAIRAVEEVFDWKAFLRENFPETELPEETKEFATEASEEKAPETASSENDKNE